MSWMSMVRGFFFSPSQEEAVEKAAARIGAPSTAPAVRVPAPLPRRVTRFPRPYATSMGLSEAERVEEALVLRRLARATARHGSPWDAAVSVFGGERRSSTASVSGPGSPLSVP